MRSCSKCMLRKRAKAMHITVHEWPLPTRHLEGEAIVFELKCPPVFAIWRTRTYQILRDIGMAHSQSKSVSPFLLERYGGLSAWSKGARQVASPLGRRRSHFSNPTTVVSRSPLLNIVFVSTMDFASGCMIGRGGRMSFLPLISTSIRTAHLVCLRDYTGISSMLWRTQPMRIMKPSPIRETVL
jgi:hypothetical protein